MREYAAEGENSIKDINEIDQINHRFLKSYQYITFRMNFRKNSVQCIGY